MEGIILLGFVVLLIIRRIIRNKRDRKIRQSYHSEEGKFKIKGRESSFKIRKGKYLEFLVEKGEIVACRDLRVGGEFKYYGGEKNESN